MRLICGASATLVLGTLALSAARPVPYERQRRTPILPNGVELDTTGTLIGTLVGRDDGKAVQYGTVSLGEKGAARFTDGDGHFRVTLLVPGQYQIKARQIGYAAMDTVVQVSGAPAVTTVTLRMVHLSPPPRPIRVEAHGSKDCVSTGAPDSMANPGLAAIFAQLRENAERFALLLDQYPVRYTRETRNVRHLETSNDLVDRSNYQTYCDTRTTFEQDCRRANQPLLLGERDSTLYVGADTRELGRGASYRVGGVLYDEGPPHFRLPALADLGDSAFVAAHCFSFGGEQSLESKSKERVLRLDFRPAAAILTPDVEGSVFLDAERLVVRRVLFRLTKLESLDAQVPGVTFTMTYFELLPFLPVVGEARTETSPQQGGASGPRFGMPVTFIITDRMSSYQFVGNAPGEQRDSLPRGAGPA